MKNKRAVRRHWITIILGILVAGGVGVAATYFFSLSLAFKLALATLIPFFIVGGMFLFVRRNKLVVPKYPKEKRINKTIRYFYFVDFLAAALVAFYLLKSFIF